MDGWMEGVGRCQVWLPNATSARKSDESFDVVPSPPPCLSNPHRGPPASTCMCTSCTTPCTPAPAPAPAPGACTCTCTWVFPPSRPSRLPYPKTQRPPSRQPRGLLHCLPVHSRLQHCIFPDPHLSPASASSSRNGNASARGRRNAFLLPVSALALTVSFLSAAWNIPLCAAVCSLHSASALRHVMPCHAMPCHAVPRCIHRQHSTHTYERAHT